MVSKMINQSKSEEILINTLNGNNLLSINQFSNRAITVQLMTVTRQWRNNVGLQ